MLRYFGEGNSHIHTGRLNRTAVGERTPASFLFPLVEPPGSHWVYHQQQAIGRDKKPALRLGTSDTTGKRNDLIGKGKGCTVFLVHIHLQVYRRTAGREATLECHPFAIGSRFCLVWLIEPYY